MNDSHPHRITSTKCCKNTVVSPDDGLIVARNMLRKEINILRSTKCAPSWLYLQVIIFILLLYHLRKPGIVCVKLNMFFVSDIPEHLD